MVINSLAHMSDSIDALDRRIIGALQVDARASWFSVARALQENERTVARRGTRLLEHSIVRVAGVQLTSPGTILALRCGPGQVRMCAQAISGRPESMWTHIVTGTDNVIAEVSYPKEKKQMFLLEELPTLPGMVSSVAYPVVRILRTAHQWRSNLLSSQERELLETVGNSSQKLTITGIEDLSSSDQAIHGALVKNGRATYEELARIAGVSEATARRRVEHMRQSGQLVVRAVVDPVVLGLGVNVVIWVKAKPAHLQRLSSAIELDTQIRYASRITGPYQVFLALDLASMADLDIFLESSEWVEHALEMDVAVVVATVMRGGQRNFAQQ